MFETADIREWRDHDVIDVHGHKIGTLEAVYVDTGTDEPCFGTIKVGLRTRNRLVFASLAGATLGPGYVRLSQPKKQVKRAPSIQTGGELPASDEEAIFAHYHLPYQAAPNQRRLARR